MKLTGLQAFVAVLESGSIHAGARNLGVSQPALSKTLRALEDELGVQLVTRTSRGTVATAYGRAFLQRAKLVVREVAKAQQEIAQMQGNLQGSLGICIAPVSLLRLFPMAVEAFRHECPDIEIHITESLQPESTELVRSNVVEMAIGPLSTPLPVHEFRAEPLMQVDLVLVARRNHPAAKARKLNELIGCDWLQVGPGGTSSEVAEQLFRENGLEPPAMAVTCQSLTGAISLLASVDLIAVLPRPLLDLAQFNETFCEVEVERSPTINKIGLIYRADSPLTPAGQIMATHIRRSAASLVGNANDHQLAQLARSPRRPDSSDRAGQI